MLQMFSSIGICERTPVVKPKKFKQRGIKASGDFREPTGQRGNVQALEP